MPTKKTATKKTTRKRTRAKQAKVAPAPSLVGDFDEEEGESTAGFRLRRMALSECVEHPRNQEVRKHPAPGTPRWDTLKASLEHDYFDPLVWNVRNGQLVSGHLRKKVMEHEGLFTHALVVEVDYDEPTHLARLLAANRGMGDDDVEGQKTFLKELSEVDGFKLDWSGFTAPEIDAMDVFEEPDFDFGGDDEGNYDEDDEEESETEGGGEAERGIKYFQLIYQTDDHAKFARLLNAYRDQHETELREAFGEDWKDLANVVLHLLETNTEEV